MVKIKQKKTMNLPQLIEWGFGNDIKKATYRSENGLSVDFSFDGKAVIGYAFSKHDTFTVEEEIEIDEYTVFHTLVKVIEDGTVYTCTDATINREKNSAVVEIHAILNGVLKLIWTHDKGLVE